MAKLRQADTPSQTPDKNFADNTKISYWQYLKFCCYFFIEHFTGKYFRSLGFAKRRELLTEKCIQYLIKKGEKGRKLEIPTVTGDPGRKVFLSRYFYTAEPMIFKGIAADWPSKKWDFRFFEKHFGDTKAILIDHRGLIDTAVKQDHEITNLRDYVRHVRAGGKKYLKFSPLLKNHPELNEDFGRPWLSAMRNRTSMREEAQLFMGPAKTLTPIHCALECNLFVQIHGRKKWFIYPARNFPLISPPAARFPYFYSDVDPEKDSNPDFPLFRFADYYEFILEPGDVLWNPPFMWHHIRNLTETVGIGYRYHSFRAAFRATKFLTMMRFLATKPFLLETLYLSLTKSNFLFKAAEKKADPYQ